MVYSTKVARYDSKEPNYKIAHMRNSMRIVHNPSPITHMPHHGLIMTCFSLMHSVMSTPYPMNYASPGKHPKISHSHTPLPTSVSYGIYRTRQHPPKLKKYLQVIDEWNTHATHTRECTKNLWQTTPHCLVDPSRPSVPHWL